MNTAQAVPFADLSIQWRQIRARALPDLEKLFESSAYCLGPWVESFEKASADYLGVKHAIAVNSGTSALHLAAIVAGIGPGDKVMVPAQTFAVERCGGLSIRAQFLFCAMSMLTAARLRWMNSNAAMSRGLRQLFRCICLASPPL